MYQLNLTQIFSGSDAIFLHGMNGDLPGKFLDVNAAACQRLGYTHQELLSMCPSDIDAPEGAIFALQAVKKLITAKTATWESVHLSKIGERIPVEINANLFDLDGKPVVLSIVRDLRERKKAEAELVWKTAFLEALANSSIDGVLVVSEQGRRIFANQRFIEYMEVPPSVLSSTDDEGLLRHVSGIVCEPIRFIERVKHLYSHPDEIGMDIVELKNGRAFERYSAAVQDKSGKRYGRIWIFHEITERKKSEKARRASEIRFGSLFEHMTEGVALHELVYDEHGRPVDYRVLSVNPAFSRHTGLSAEAVVGRSASKLYGTGAAPYLEKYARVAQTNEPISFDTYFDQMQKHFTISVFSPGPGQFATVFSDITDRKLAEERLRASQQIIEGIINAIPVRVFWKDRNLVYLGCNAIFARDAGFSDPKDIIGKDDYHMGWREQADLYRGDDKAVIESGCPKMFIEENQTTPDGKTITLLTSKLPLRGPDGKITGVLGTYVDITDRKRMEEDLIKAHKLDSLGVLAGGIAHDFNNFLTGIVGNISLALQNIDPNSGTFELLSEAELAVSQARSLTLQLLTFAKGGAPVKKLTGLAGLIKEAAVFATRGTKIKCEFKMDEDLHPGMVDPGQISQVVNNLVINAVQAMPEGGTVSFRARNTDLPEDAKLQLKSGRYIRIDIKDTGGGIRTDHRDRIFDPYFTTKQTGSGLGLATCYSIIKKHDGHISVESEVGKGTVFSIYLPAFMGGPALPAPQRSRDMVKGHGRILVMDDEPGICILLTKVLTQLGYAVETVSNGDKALALYSAVWKTKESFDAVILDLTVAGGKGGQETIKELLKINPKIKALVSSGYADDPIMANFKNYGFSAVLAKPYDAQELSQSVHQLLADNA